MQEERYADLYWDRDPNEKKKFIAQLAPIVLFTYNRLEHTKQTIEALRDNVYAAESELFIYSDAPKNEEVAVQVQAVRKYLHSIDGFKKIIIIERNENWGLAKNIIDGVTKIVNQYGKIIVLEDDIVTSKFFLKYMNDALKVYKNEIRVIEINGYSYPIDNVDLPEAFFVKLGGCWGWATWSDRWKYFSREPQKIKDSFTSEDIYKFNLEGKAKNYFFPQIVDNCEGRLYTWAIFWMVVVFRRGYSLNPAQPLCKNIGHDASGIHCGNTNSFDVELNFCDIKNFPIDVVQSDIAHIRIGEFIQKISYIPLWRKVLHYVIPRCALKVMKWCYKRICSSISIKEVK